MSYGYAFAELTFNYSSSIPTVGGEPIRIATDDTGMLYVASPRAGGILKYSQDGSFDGIIRGFVKPVSVAVDGSRQVYVGDAADGSVRVFGSDGKFIFSLGKGKEEFGMPGDIAIASNGTVYVTDSLKNIVNVYAPDGTPRLSFGGYGTSAGQMIFPTGIAADDANQEIYVVDYTNGRVLVFDLNGLFKRSFGTYGSGQGRLTRPQGIHIANGRVYVADAFQSTVEVFDTAGNFVAFIGQYGTGPGNLKIPMDVNMIGTMLFVSNFDNRRIEVFDIVEPQGLRITPSTLSFTADSGTLPPTQTIQVDPEVAGNTPSWTASITSPFPISLNPSSGTVPSTVAVSVDVTGLAPGVYTGAITFLSSGNIEYPVAVEVTVLQSQKVLVSPDSINLFYQKDGVLASKPLSITSTNGSLQWTATTGAQWLDVLPASGSTPGTLNVSLNQNANALAEGTYTASVTVTAPNAIGSPFIVPVSLKVVEAGSIIVNTNLDAASFTIAGPTPNSGSGKTWRTDEAKPGTYDIQFGFVKGYRKPATRSFVLMTGKAITIDVQYQPLEVANIIVAAKGPGPNNNTIIRVLDLNGNPVSEFKAFTARNGGNTKYGAKVATADIDGDGTSEIIVTPGPGEDNRAAMKVFRYDGTLLSSVGPIDHTEYGASVAAGDILGDGQHEVALSMVMEDSEHQTIIIYQFSGYSLAEKVRLSIPGESKYPANLAFGDLDGDGVLELIVASEGGVSIYAFNETLTPTPVVTGTLSLPGSRGHEEQSHAYKFQMTVSAGDIDGSGIDAMIIGYSDALDSYVGFFDDSLKPLGPSLEVFVKAKSVPTLSAMDCSGDGTAEILAGKGAKRENDATVRLYSPDGTMLKEIKAFDASVRFGVNAVFGVKK